MPEHYTKAVKLQPKFRTLASSQKIVPELKISGIWLEEQGFYAGQTVEITIADKQLIIKAL
jgi:hypothetical protein